MVYEEYKAFKQEFFEVNPEATQEECDEEFQEALKQEFFAENPEAEQEYYDRIFLETLKKNSGQDS